MQTKKAFDSKKYLKEEKKLILERMKKFHTLYLEIGGHLLYDAHASRVLPGYDPKNKLKLMKGFGKKVGLVYCVSAKNFNGEKWSTSRTAIASYALKEIKALSKHFDILAVAINRFSGEEKALGFIQKIEKLGFEVVVTTEIKGYPDLRKAFSRVGFFDQPFLKTKKDLVIVTGAGSNNGKLFFCLSQIYNLAQEGKDAGYAKLETFPIYNLPIDHEVNLAYEAATADINDRVVKDTFHKKHYGKDAVNYNRDVESFPVLKRIISKMCTKKNYMNHYHSPTDMGLNAAKKGIIDDKIARDTGKKEILFRLKKFKQAKNKKAVRRIEEILKKLEKF